MTVRPVQRRINAGTGDMAFTSQILQGRRDYVAKLRLFQRNAWLYLLNTIVIGLSFGIFRLLFNFYVLSLGHDEALLGQLLTVSSLVSLAGALPAGYFSDRLGRKPSLLLSTVLYALAMLGLVVLLLGKSSRSLCSPWILTSSFRGPKSRALRGQAITQMGFSPFTSRSTQRVHFRAFTPISSLSKTGDP